MQVPKNRNATATEILPHKNVVFEAVGGDGEAGRSGCDGQSGMDGLPGEDATKVQDATVSSYLCFMSFVKSHFVLGWDTWWKWWEVSHSQSLMLEPSTDCSSAGTGTNGGDAGNGGQFRLYVDEDKTYLLLAASWEVRGGKGGVKGEHGTPGPGGKGGKGGQGITW